MKKITLTTTLLLILIKAAVYSQDVNVSVNMPASAQPGSEFKVELTVNKGSVSGFAKLQQELPPGMTATAGESANATFSFKENKAKFLWMALPADASFKLSYTIKVGGDLSGPQTITGTFSYILNNNTEKLQVAAQIINIGGAGEPTTASSQSKPANPEVKSTPTPVVEPVKTEQPVVTATTTTATQENLTDEDKLKIEKQKLIEEKIKRLKQEVEEREKNKGTKTTPEPTRKTPGAVVNAEPSKSAPTVQGLVFKVQVAATKSNTPTSFFKDKFKLPEEVYVEDHEGWKKFTTGSFSTYVAAKAYCNNIRDNNGVVGPFVTAYKDGTRITVQEALNMTGK